jgi:hypothetical protein
MLELTANPGQQMQLHGVQRLTDSDAPEVLDFCPVVHCIPSSWQVLFASAA